MMHRHKVIEIAKDKLFIGEIFPGFKTELYLLRFYQYPSGASIIEKYLTILKNKFDSEPNYEKLFQFVVLMDYISYSTLSLLLATTEKYCVVDVKEVGDLIKLTFKVSYKK